MTEVHIFQKLEGYNLLWILGKEIDCEWLDINTLNQYIKDVKMVCQDYQKSKY